MFGGRGESAVRRESSPSQPACFVKSRDCTGLQIPTCPTTLHLNTYIIRTIVLIANQHGTKERVAKWAHWVVKVVGQQSPPSDLWRILYYSESWGTAPCIEIWHKRNWFPIDDLLFKMLITNHWNTKPLGGGGRNVVGCRMQSYIKKWGNFRSGSKRSSWNTNIEGKVWRHPIYLYYLSMWAPEHPTRQQPRSVHRCLA